MAASSIKSGIISFDLSLFGAAGDPMDTVLMRDGVMNGLLHLADEFAQIRCNWAAQTVPIKNGYRTTTTSAVADEWYRIGEVARWPIQFRANGNPYKVRIRIGGHSNNASYTATFGAVLSPPATGPIYIGVGDDWVFHTAGTTGTTPAWLTGTSQGTVGSATILTLPTAADMWWSTPESTLADLGGNPASVTQTIVSLTIFGKTSNASGEARLDAVHASEYIG